MKYLIALILGLGSVTALSCMGTQSADATATRTMIVSVSGMT